MYKDSTCPVLDDLVFGSPLGNFTRVALVPVFGETSYCDAFNNVTEGISN